MAKKPQQQDQTEAYNYFQEEKPVSDQGASLTDKMVTSLRSDMVPGSLATPARKSIFQRINIKVLLGILLASICIVLVWYFSAGPGSPLLGNKLISLAKREATATATFAPTYAPTSTITPLPTYTPARTSTKVPTRTPVIVTPSSTMLSQNMPTSTSSADCRDALSITMDDVGKTLCVKGIVIETVEKPTNFMVVFSNKSGAFYWVTYDLVWSKAELGSCYQIHGTISEIANNPMLVFGYSNLPEACP